MCRIRTTGSSVPIRIGTTPTSAIFYSLVASSKKVRDAFDEFKYIPNTCKSCTKGAVKYSNLRYMVELPNSAAFCEFNFQ